MKHLLSRLSFLALFLPLTVSAASADFIVLDVRTPAEYSESHLKESLNIDFLAPDFKNRISKLDKEKTYKLYCRSGNRSGKALEVMKAQGFKNLENLGSLHEASVKLKQSCVGQGPC